MIICAPPPRAEKAQMAERGQRMRIRSARDPVQAPLPRIFPGQAPARKGIFKNIEFSFRIKVYID